MEKIIRACFLEAIKQAFIIHPIVALLGPRQSGKTTIAKQFAEEKDVPAVFFDLENPNDLGALSDPYNSLKKIQGLVVIDEIQHSPDLFKVLRVLVDENPKQCFLILGSASSDLINQAAESLAGRIQYIELTPFSLQEVNELDRLWLRGGFPRSYLAKDDVKSFEWKQAFIRTFLERDLNQLGFNFSAVKIQRFWEMLSHYNGQLLNVAELSNSLRENHKTIRHYLDALVGTFIVRELKPWYENIKKRQVKSTKIFFRDTGLFHSMLNVTSLTELIKHPKLGISWESMAMEEIIRFHQARDQECFFWATHNQAELDLYIKKYGEAYAFEFKFSDSPKVTKSMRIAIEDLNLECLTIIYPGEKSYDLDDRIRVVNLQQYINGQ